MKALVKTKGTIEGLSYMVFRLILNMFCNVYGILGLIAWVASLWLFHHGFTGHDGGFMMKWFWGYMYSALPGLMAIVLLIKSIGR